MKRTLPVLALVVALVPLLAGCGQSGTSSTATPPSSSSSTVLPTEPAAGASPTTIEAIATEAVGGATPSQSSVRAPGEARDRSPQSSPTAAAATAAPVAQTSPIVTGTATTVQASATHTGTASAPSGKSFVNPVLQSDFADPDVIRVGNTFYAYATNAAGKNIQAARSTDMINWEPLTDAMPALPSWAVLGGSYVWAPSVIQIGDRFVMYYTARDQTADKQCIGVATAGKPDAKFLDKNDKAFICVPDEGGDIDAAPLSDGGKLYLYWKNDGNCCGITTYIYGQELSADGLSLVGKPTRLVQNDLPWEGRVVEGPQMFKHGSGYYLFFSAGNYADTTYSVGVATCDGPLGPCKSEPDPILHSKIEKEPLVIGPGGESVIQVGDQTWMFYHVWNEVSGSRGDARYMWLDRVDWQDNKPVVKGPTTDRQPAPVIP